MANKRLPVMFLLAVFLFLFEQGLTASAGTLTIETQAVVKTEGDRLLGTIRVFNKGNVDAHNVRANVIVLGKRIRTPVKKLLSVNEFCTFSVEDTLSGIKKGRYPLTVIVDFNDATQYPFSAVSCTTFSFQQDVSADLICVADNLTIDKKGQLYLSVRNPGGETKTVQATLVLPKELSSPRPIIHFDIQAKREKRVFFEIENNFAIAGAAYPVFCSIQYDLQDTHYTALSGAIVNIAPRLNWFHRTRWFWAALAVLLGTIFALFRMKKAIKQNNV